MQDWARPATDDGRSSLDRGHWAIDDDDLPSSRRQRRAFARAVLLAGPGTILSGESHTRRPGLGFDHLERRARATVTSLIREALGQAARLQVA